MNRVKELRLEQGKTQDHLAQVAGLKRQAIGKIEAGGGMRGDTLVRLSQEFNVDADYLQGKSPLRKIADRLPLEWEQTVHAFIAMGLAPADVRQAVQSWKVANGKAVAEEPPLNE